MSSLGKDWHKLCLKCDRCNKLLNAGGHAEVSKTPSTTSNSTVQHCPSLLRLYECDTDFNWECLRIVGCFCLFVSFLGIMLFFLIQYQYSSITVVLITQGQRSTTPNAIGCFFPVHWLPLWNLTRGSQCFLVMYWLIDKLYLQFVYFSFYILLKISWHISNISQVTLQSTRQGGTAVLWLKRVSSSVHFVQEIAERTSFPALLCAWLRLLIWLVLVGTLTPLTLQNDLLSDSFSSLCYAIRLQ